MTAAIAFGSPTTGRIGAMPMPPQGLPRVCAVRLIDLRTGAVHRINGTPLTILTRNPTEAAAELLSGRDPSVWEARVDALGPEARK